MYEQISHSLLNRILDELKPEIRERDLRHFYTRLGGNFYAIYSLFHLLYGAREDFEQQMVRLVETMATQYIWRDSSLKQLDSIREHDHNWFLSQEWVGMVLEKSPFPCLCLRCGQKWCRYLHHHRMFRVHLQSRDHSHWQHRSLYPSCPKR